MLIELIPTIILSLVVLALLIALFLQNKAHSQQTEGFVKALIAKNAQEYVDLKHVDKDEPEKIVVSDEIPLSDLPDDKYLEVLEKGMA